MKKRLIPALLLIVAMLAACLALTVLNTAAVEEGYYVIVQNADELSELKGKSAENAPIILDGASVSADAAGRGGKTVFFNGYVATNQRVRSYKVYMDGSVASDALSYSFNKLDSYSAGSEYMGEESPKSATFNITVKIPEGTYNVVSIVAVDAEGGETEVIRLTNLTVTAPTKELQENYPEEAEPCYTLTANDLIGGTSPNAVSVTLSEDGSYAVFVAEQKGDPYAYYFTGTETHVGRYLLLKYRNNSEIPRAQFYIAQGAGIASDKNMIEFPVEAYSEWTYAIVDLAENDCYNTETQSLMYFRFDPLEARNCFSDDYVFTGNESMDVAYIMGFTTLAGAKHYLEEKELHEVTKTLGENKASEIESDDGRYYYTNARGERYELTAVEGVGYTYATQDVRAPFKGVPTLLLTGSALAGNNPTNATVSSDMETGIVTVTPAQEDPYYTLLGTVTQDPNAAGEKIRISRYMVMRYRTEAVREDGSPEKFQMFIDSETYLPDESTSFYQALEGDGQWHTLVIDLAAQELSRLNTDTYEVNYVRFDVFDKVYNKPLEIEYVAFFDSEDAACQYVHSYKIYRVTFKADNKTVGVVYYEPGTTEITPPPVPEIEGYRGEWEPFTLSDSNLVVRAKYTRIATTDQSGSSNQDTGGETTGELPKDTEGGDAGTTTGGTTTADPDSAQTDVPPKENNGCGSVLGSVSMILTLLCCFGYGMRKKD